MHAQYSQLKNFTYMYEKKSQIKCEYSQVFIPYSCTGDGADVSGECWGLTGEVGAGGGAVPQQDVDEFEADACRLEADFHQDSLDVGRVHTAVW